MATKTEHIARCIGILHIIIQIAVMACAVASPVLMTQYLIYNPIKELGEVYSQRFRWHAGFGWAYLATFMAYGCTNRGTTAALNSFRSLGTYDAKEGASAMTQARDFLIGIVMLVISIGYSITSFTIYWKFYNNADKYYPWVSAVCGMVSVIVGFIIVPTTLLCVFCAVCTRFTYSSVRNQAKNPKLDVEADDSSE